MIGLKRGIVKLLPYNPNWQVAFEREKKFLKKELDGLILEIQHIGSTAIPGIVAKPIIDMLIAVNSLSDVSKIRSKLEEVGYEYRENGSDDIQILFVKGPEGKRTYYLHITELGSLEWQNSIGFRDYLRKNTERAKQYSNLKMELASKYSEDRAKYTAGKAAFVHETIERAK